jgi:hypothetical protein
MSTTTFEKAGGLIPVTCIMQSIDVIISNLASGMIIIVMHIIITLKNGGLAVYCHRMMMSKIMVACIGKQRVEQTQYGSAK